MFGAVGAPIDRLVRVRIGPVRLDELGVAAPADCGRRRSAASGPGPARAVPGREARPKQTRRQSTSMTVTLERPLVVCQAGRRCRERAGAPRRGRAAVGTVGGLPRGHDVDRLPALARAGTRARLRRLRGAVALVGRRPRRVLDVGRRLLRHPVARAWDHVVGRARCRRPMVRGRDSIRGGAPAPGLARQAGAPRPSRNGTRCGGQRGGADGAVAAVAAGLRRLGVGRGDRVVAVIPNIPEASSPAGVREPRRDLVVLLARLRDPEPGRPVRPDRTDGPPRGRWVHVRRQAVRSPRLSSTTCAPPCPTLAADGPHPVPRSRTPTPAGADELVWADLVPGRPTR